MKKTNKFRYMIIIMFCIAMRNFISAQDTKAIISANIGASIPLMNRMGSADEPIKTGFSYDINGTYFISNNVGISGMISRQQSSVSNINYCYYYNINSYFNDCQIFHEDFKRTNIFVGPCFAINFNKVSVDINPFMGLSINRLPSSTMEQTGYVYGPIATTYSFYNSFTYDQFAGGISADIRISLSDKFSIRFFGSYIASEKYNFLSTGAGVAYVIKNKIQ